MTNWQIVGHERTVSLLRNGLESGRLAHAHLLVGPPHVGKMTLSLTLAQALNCSSKDKPCGECTSCQRTAERRHADINVIDLNGRAEIGIDHIRELERTANLKPFEGQHRVFIINNADSLSTEAANCLLKTLEEPPPYVYILLLASNERMLLPTIRSRCQILELRPLPFEVIERTLVERYGAHESHAALLARLSRGCIGWAIDAWLNDGILKGRNEQIDSLIQLASKGISDRFSFASDLAERFAKDRESVKETLSLWISWWRDMLLVCSGCPEHIINLNFQDTLQREIVGYNIYTIKFVICGLQQSISALDRNANPRLVLEVAMLNLPQKKGAGNT